MPDYTAKRIDDMEAIFGGSFVRVRAELGVEAFGMQVIDMPPNGTRYPEHDHSESGQEEVFVTLRGAGEIEIDGERTPLDPDTIVRVGPDARRKILPGPQGLRVLALGGTPGTPYQPSEFSRLGAPDPTAG
jgi:mannose-6-phosphate isomerase-like protein (cupin superfamily)